jgi:hypothetical protein
MVGLRLAAHKSVHMALRWLQGSARDRQMQVHMADEDLIGVEIGDTRIPQVDFDVGFRYLGCWLDASGDGGEQQARLFKCISEFAEMVNRARTPPGATVYLYKAVLLPRVMFPLTVACLSRSEIDCLEQAAWRALAARLGAWASMSVTLRHLDPNYGGLGLRPWHELVALRRAGLVRQMTDHPVP